MGIALAFNIVLSVLSFDGTTLTEPSFNTTYFTPAISNDIRPGGLSSVQIIWQDILDVNISRMTFPKERIICQEQYSHEIR